LTHVEGGLALAQLVFTAGYPYGIETNSTSFAETAITTSPHAMLTEFDGSAPARPFVTITLNTFSGTSNRTISLYNPTTGKVCTVTRSDWANGDVIIFDMKLKTVRRNGILQDFNGVFPEFEAGDVIAYSDTFSARNVNISVSYFREFV
jgi:hypothetical protein